MPELTLATAAAGTILASLIAYVLMGGADFGGGVWDLLASGPRKTEQREAIARALGPIWEANHVWLILVVVLLFVAFPAAFARISIALHIPLTLLLVGIVLRGSAFTFRTYDSQRDQVQQRWGLVFSISSLLTPLLLGVCVGAITTGAVGTAQSGSFVDVYVRPWLTPFDLGVGLMTVTVCAFLAAVYLTNETTGPLQEDFRRRALAAAVTVFAAAWGTLFLTGPAGAAMRERLLRQPWSLPVQALIAVSAIVTLLALWRRQYRLARAAAPAQVTLILVGWALTQYPYIVPPTLTVQDAAAPDATLALLLLALGAGAVLLFPSLYYLFRIFKSRPQADQPGQP
ncbi:MAG: cytochrome d ubiquinol oxidase subunit II [Gemmatimonadota bacterium]